MIEIRERKDRSNKLLQFIGNVVVSENKLLLTDTTMRDAHQSLLTARFRTYDLLQVAEATN